MKTCDWTGDPAGTEERCGKVAHECVPIRVTVTTGKGTPDEQKKFSGVNRWFCPEHWEKTPWGQFC